MDWEVVCSVDQDLLEVGAVVAWVLVLSGIQVAYL